tara:strand:- start:528 stop:755 length:228 start_codon:yes stop_codon:yes gene_type:complete
MIYHYHPILGLQYYCEDFIVIDLNAIPQNPPMSIEEALYLVKAQGIQIVNSSLKPAIDFFVSIKTNAISTFNNLF